jgi:hypothetical protein
MIATLGDRFGGYDLYLSGSVTLRADTATRSSNRSKGRIRLFPSSTKLASSVRWISGSFAQIGLDLSVEFRKRYLE